MSLRRIVVSTVASLAVVLGMVVPGLAAHAADGTGVVAVSITPVDYLTGAPQTTASNGEHGNTVAYKVNFSCTAGPCDATTVQLGALQKDPYGFNQSLLYYSTWTAPFTGATISSATQLVSLGNLAAGTSSSFLIVYGIIPLAGNYTTPTTAQVFPGGFQIANSATIASPTAGAPATSAAAAVTWNSTVPTPSVSLSNPGVVAPGAAVTNVARMGDGSFVFGSGRIAGSSAYQGAGSYVVVEQLPAQAVYQSSTGGGTYDPVAHTVTWTMGTVANPQAGAVGGWGSSATSGWTTRGTYGPYSVVVTYPASKFPEADAGGCNFEVPVTTTVTATLTYLDTARTVKSASTNSTNTVSCYSPFGRGTILKESRADASSGSTRLQNVPPDVTGLTCPASRQDAWGRACTTVGAPLAVFSDTASYWQVVARNAGNVPGVAVIRDLDLDQPDAPVYSISPTATTPVATVAWTYRCGTAAPVSGTTAGAATLSDADQAAGCRYTSATITSGSLAGYNIRPADTGVGTAFTVNFHYKVTKTAPIGQTRTNTASGTMSYPGYPQVTDVPLPSSPRTIQFRAMPLAAPVVVAKPNVVARFAASPVVSGGGQAVPGRNVTFSILGATANIPDDTDITPQYVFIAPVGWAITPGSASFPAGSVPSTVSFSYRTVTIAGVARQAVVATWPDSTSFGKNVNWPAMSVVAQPTFAVAAGTTSVAAAWVADSRNTWDNSTANFTGATADAPDVDGDGNTAEWFSTVTQSIPVSSSDGLSVTKEICQPNPITAVCTWISDPDTLVAVSTTASNITYRVTLQNSGNTTLTGVVAYDVLPYIGDTGTSTGTAGTPRGSTFAETLNAVSNVSSNLTLAYSASRNPSRPQVYTGTTAPDDWAAGAANKTAVRATVNGSLAPGVTASFTYTANVVTGAVADAKACNSIAVDSTQTLPSEPRPVCASTQEADLSVSVPNRLPLQNGRPGILPFTVTNGGGSQNATATVTVPIPAGVTVTNLTPAGWSCSAGVAVAAPVVGPVSLSCSPVTSTGTPRPLAKDVPDTLAIPVTPTTGGSLCVPASVTGPMNDPVPANNQTEGCLTVLAAAAGIGLTKSDGLTAVGPGQQFSYTLTARNLLVGESLSAPTLRDTLPSGLIFVSASDGGALSGVTPGAPGGTVTWTLPTLAPAGVTGPGGDGGTGGAGSGAAVTITVKLAPGVKADVTNTATVSAVDPAKTPAILSATATDTDAVRAVSIAKTSNAASIGVSVGDVITYTVTERNVGTADYTVANPATISDDLSAVLAKASFVAGSATVKIDGGTAIPVAAPTAGVLGWSGALPVGSSAVLSYRVTVTSGMAALVNTAYTAPASSCVGSVDPNGLPCATLTDAFAPVLSIVKTATLNDANGNGTADAGETVSYSFVVTNTGGTDAAAVAVVDPKLRNLTPASASIPAGQSKTFSASSYTVTQADVTSGGLLSNTAKATGATTTGLAVPDSPSSTATVPITAAAPALKITKSGTLTDTNANGKVDVGEKIAYRFVVENIGNVPVHGIEVHDTRLSNLAPVGIILQPGQQAVFTADDYVGTQADFDAGGIVINTATVTGLDPQGDPIPTPDPSSTTTPLADPVAGLSIVKTATLGDLNGNGVADAGEKISYGFVVQNTGNVTQHSVKVVDAKVKNLAPASVTLIPGQKAAFTASDYTVTQADIDAQLPIVNTATATGLDPADEPTTSGPSTATTPVRAAVASLSIVKTATLNDSDDNGTADAGETISYGFLVTNTGTVTASEVTVADVVVANIAPAPLALAPGASQLFTADDYTVTQADLDAQVDIVNTATAVGVDPTDEEITSDPSTATTPVTTAAPLLSIVKSGDLSDANGNGKVDVGDTIAYSFVVTNVGNVTIHDIVVTDAKVTGITPATATLAPGEQQIFTADSYEGTQADIDAGGTVSNIAFASGLDPRDVALPPVSSEVVTPLADPTPVLSIVKTATLNDKNGNGRADAGETISYSFVVQNTGNLTIRDASVTDPKVSGLAPATVGILLPGQKATFTADDYTVTAADVVHGEVSNTATAAGADPRDAVVISPPSTVVTKTGPVPVIPGQLSFTGANPLPTTLAALLLIAMGAAIVLTGRLRRRTRYSRTDA
jgi:uncharacterized repeat protein (TIGR01451 family)